MKTKVQSKHAKSGTLIVPVFSDELKKPSRLPKTLADFVKERYKAKEFTAKINQRLFTYIKAKSMPEKVIFAGLGDAKKLTDRRVRNLAGHIAKQIKSNEEKDISLLLPTELEDHVGAFLEAFRSAQYNICQYKSKHEKDCNYEAKSFVVVTESKKKSIKEQIDRAEIISDGIYLIRDLINGPANKVDHYFLADTAKKIAKDNKYKFALLKQKDLKKMGWGGLLAVNQGARNEALCAVVEYNGAKDKREKPIVLVGKGMIFDAGGYNIKPTNYIEDMHQDMGGAATVLGVMSVLKKLGVRKNVIGITPIAENMIDKDAYRPSDVLTMLSGHTVEILNTDAEGRLILADAITYGCKFKPQSIITIATLTGASGVATGNRFASLMGNDDDFRNALQEAGDEVDDLAWPLPLHEDYDRTMNSKIADFRNIAKGDRGAGSSKAGHFLAKFIQDNDWCHLDIGGTAYTTEPKPYQVHGATGHTLNLLARYFEKISD